MTIRYPSEWLTLPCRWCGKSRREHGALPTADAVLCLGLTEYWAPMLPTDRQVDCRCRYWAFDDDVAAIWPEAGEWRCRYSLPAGHHPACEHYEPPPTLELTIAALEQRLERLKEYRRNGGTR